MLKILKYKCEKLMEKDEDWIFKIAINLFNDGECIDFGARIVVCDFEEENFRNIYYSFTLEDEKLSEYILKYIKEDGSENEVQRQQYLAECLKENLIKCNWIDSRTDIYVKEYD